MPPTTFIAIDSSPGEEGQEMAGWVRTRTRSLYRADRLRRRRQDKASCSRHTPPPALPSTTAEHNMWVLSERQIWRWRRTSPLPCAHANSMASCPVSGKLPGFWQAQNADSIRKSWPNIPLSFCASLLFNHVCLDQTPQGICCATITYKEASRRNTISPSHAIVCHRSSLAVAHIKAVNRRDSP